MIEGINLTAYIILSILFYLYIVIFAMINIIPGAGELYIKLKNAATKNESLRNILSPIKKALLPARGLLIKALVYLRISCEGLFDFEKGLARHFNNSIGEPVNYTSLIIRKVYEGNPQQYIVYSAFSIVVFYFILTIF